MSTREGERRALIVIKSRGFPARRIVTARTVRSIFPGRELSGVGVVMASEALLGSRAEINIPQTSLNAWRTMAIAAGYTAMCAEKWKLRF
jgi:hypothetical protein